MPDIQWHMEGDEISLRDLRNHVSEVLRRVEGGTPLTVTVDRTTLVEFRAAGVAPPGFPNAYLA